MDRRPPISSGLNVFLMCVVLGGTLFQLFGMPWLLREVGLGAAWLLVPIMLIQPLHWGLIHEAIHSHLFPRRRANELCARLLSVTHWLPFDATRFCHLVHHRFSRHAYDQPDLYDGTGAYALAWLRYRGRLLGGVYLGVLISPLIAFIPVSLDMRVMKNAIPIDEEGDWDVRRLLLSLAMNVPKRRRTRLDLVAAVGLYGLSLWAYGAWWPMLLATMYVRAVWHSFADNLAHHDVAFDDPERARNYALPRLFRLLVMNQHLHLTHHRFPTAPWTSLGRLRALDDMRSHGNYFRAALRQSNRRYPRLRYDRAVPELARSTS